MSGIYIHIPYCKQKCTYCNFHFSTNTKNVEEMINAMLIEIENKKNYLKKNEIHTIYFGGGTPSLLTLEDLNIIFQTIDAYYDVKPDAEITLEANPDDLTHKRIQAFASTPINRLSIGIQSFFDEDLQLMNRAHSAKEARQCIEMATPYFDNITIDLLYGMPQMTNERWKENLQIVFDLQLNHLSCYALTVEPKTALEHFIKTAQQPPMDDAVAAAHFQILVEETAKAGYTHYEVCSFGQPHYFSKRNTSYWLGKPYLGVGPSAHSFDEKKRLWNVSNNVKYIKALAEEKLPLTEEILTPENRFNEYLMTGLRTIWGVSLERIKKEFGQTFQIELLKNAQKHVNAQTLVIDGDVLKTTAKGKFLCDGIASDLFII